MSAVIDKSDLFEMDNTPSEHFEGISQLQEQMLLMLQQGYTINKIRIELGVSYKYVQARVKTVAFTNAMAGLTDKITDFNLFKIREELVKIIQTSKNESSKIKACHELIQLEKMLIPAGLAEIVKDEIIEDSEGEEILNKLLEKYGLTKEDLKSDDEEE